MRRDKSQQTQQTHPIASMQDKRNRFFMFMGNANTMPDGPGGLRSRMGGCGPGMQYKGRRSVEEVCGYASSLCFNDYFAAYDRQDIATRIVETYPDYTWMQEPDVFENEKGKETKFEGSWAEHLLEANPLVHLRRLDILAGIGRLGILVIGVNDGKKISEPLTPDTFQIGKKRRKVVYMRPYMEGEVTISSWDSNPNSERYGLPLTYRVQPSEFEAVGADSAYTEAFQREFTVHHTRVLHFCDNAVNSPNFGISRLRRVYDRLTDILKIVAGSAEMFWKGAYSGWSFVMDADTELTTERETEMKKNIEAFMQGLDRHLLLQGVTPQSHAPNVSSPKDHLDVQLTMIAIASRIPKRIFAGSEMGKMASTQDAENWAKQVKQRRLNTAIPFLLRPYINFCIRNGIIRPPLAGAGYMTSWPELEIPSEKDVSETALNFTNALVAYTNNNLYEMMPFETYLVNVWNFPVSKASALAAEFDVEKFKKMKADMEAAKQASKMAAGGPAKSARDMQKGGASKDQKALAQERRGAK